MPTIRPSREADLDAITAIYAHHIGEQNRLFSDRELHIRSQILFTKQITELLKAQDSARSQR